MQRERLWPLCCLGPWVWHRVGVALAGAPSRGAGTRSACGLYLVPDVFDLGADAVELGLLDLASRLRHLARLLELVLHRAHDQQLALLEAVLKSSASLLIFSASSGFLSAKNSFISAISFMVANLNFCASA